MIATWVPINQVLSFWFYAGLILPFLPLLVLTLFIDEEAPWAP